MNMEVVDRVQKHWIVTTFERDGITENFEC